MPDAPAERNAGKRSNRCVVAVLRAKCKHGCEYQTFLPDNHAFLSASVVKNPSWHTTALSPLAPQLQAPQLEHPLRYQSQNADALLQAGQPFGFARLTLRASRCCPPFRPRLRGSAPRGHTNVRAGDHEANRSCRRCCWPLGAADCGPGQCRPEQIRIRGWWRVWQGVSAARVRPGDSRLCGPCAFWGISRTAAARPGRASIKSVHRTSLWSLEYDGCVAMEGRHAGCAPGTSSKHGATGATSA